MRQIKVNLWVSFKRRRKHLESCHAQTNVSSESVYMNKHRTLYTGPSYMNIAGLKWLIYMCYFSYQTYCFYKVRCFGLSLRCVLSSLPRPSTLHLSSPKWLELVIPKYSTPILISKIYLLQLINKCICLILKTSNEKQKNVKCSQMVEL